MQITFCNTSEVYYWHCIKLLYTTSLDSCIKKAFTVTHIPATKTVPRDIPDYTTGIRYIPDYKTGPRDIPDHKTGPRDILDYKTGP